MSAKTHFSDYVRHCLRFYARCMTDRYLDTKVESENRKACYLAMQDFSEHDRVMFLKIYGSGDTVPDTVYEIAKQKHIDQESIWRKLGELERKVAIYRGLL